MQKYKDFVKKLESVDLFSFKNLETKMGKNYAKLFVHNMIKNGRMIRLKKGWYSFKKSPLLLLKLLVEGYVGLGSAALIHNVWDKAVNLTILTPLAGKEIKEGEREIGEQKVIIKKISKKMYFGYQFKEVENLNVRVSDPEKTLIDMIYFNYPFLDEIKDNLLEICEIRKLRNYILLLKKRKVRGYKKIEGIIQKEI